MAAYTGLSRDDMGDALSQLLRHGLDPEWILNAGGEPFLDLRIVCDELPSSIETHDDDDHADAADDPRVIALTKVIEAAIKRLSHRETRRLLRGLFGMYPETVGLNLQMRRTVTGGFFRGHNRRVSGHGIRNQHEPLALSMLANILVAMEAKAREEELPPEDAILV